MSHHHIIFIIAYSHKFHHFVAIVTTKGECGYGPNLVVDGKIVNRVKGRENVMKALGIEEEN